MRLVCVLVRLSEMYTEVGQRELVLVVSQVRQGMRRDTVDNCFGTQRCAILSLPAHDLYDVRERIGGMCDDP